MKFNVTFLFLPFIFLGCFFLFYAIAALKWPGGHQWNHDNEGYSFVYNYFCDHLRRYGRNGGFNSGRPYILLALVFLVCSFLTFWAGMVHFWFFSRSLKWILNLTGSAIILSFSLLPVYHDPAMMSASMFAFTGFMLLHIIFYKYKKQDVLKVTFALTIFVGLNFYIWHTGYMIIALPFIQKVTFVLYAVWVWFISTKVIEHNR